LVSVAGRSLEVVKDNLNKESVPTKANAEVDFKQKEQRVTIPYGATIYKIAIDTYGANTVLAMDLIKEFNPQIEDLNWVSAGQDLLLPSLTRATLLRQQPDGSYHLIVSSFRSLAGADEHSRLLRNKGYQVTITPRRVSDDLVLHRVEIAGLKNLEEAKQIWQTGLKRMAHLRQPGRVGGQTRLTEEDKESADKEWTPALPAFALLISSMSGDYRRRRDDAEVGIRENRRRHP
jgi:hypothetical protein